MSVKAHTFKELTSWLMQVLKFEDGSLPDLQWVDKDRNQLNSLSQEYGIPFPAILISFGRTQWQSMNRGTQLGDCTIRFTLAYENYADSFDGSINQDEALKYYDFTEEVHKALNLLSGTYFSNLTRVADQEEDTQGNILKYTMEYRCTISDESADKQRSFKLVDPELVVEKGEAPAPPDDTPYYIIPER